MTTVYLVILLVHLTAAYDQVQWRRYGDPRNGGKEYALLTSSRLMDFETSRALCGSVMGYLPEPRSVGENQFISQLSGNKIFLGLRDSKVEGEWRWDSDGSLVTGFKWQNWTSYPAMSSHPTEPNGDSRQNCAIIIRNGYASSIGNDSLTTWADIGCGLTTRKIVCEKSRKCHNKMGQCYFDQGLRNILVPNVTHLCTPSVRREIESCINAIDCDDAQDHRNHTLYLRRYNQELCSLNSVNWTDWDTTSTNTCRNNLLMEVDAAKQNERCRKFENRADLDDCGKADAVFACWVNDVARACSRSVRYNNYMKELQRAALRAMKATIFRHHTLPPHNCPLTIP